jgi:hypothetical protein
MIMKPSLEAGKFSQFECNETRLFQGIRWVSRRSTQPTALCVRPHTMNIMKILTWSLIGPAFIIPAIFGGTW